VFLNSASLLSSRSSSVILYGILFVLSATAPQWDRASSFTRFQDPTQRRITVGRSRPLPDNTHNTHNKQTSTLPGGIRTHHLSRRAAADLRLRPQGHWDRPLPHFIYSFSSLSYDMSKASSKASSPHSAIYCFLLQMRVFSPFLKVIQ